MKTPAFLLSVTLLFLSLAVGVGQLLEKATAEPVALVSDLYQKHDAGHGPFFQTKNRARLTKYFVQELADLLWNDFVNSKEEVGALNGDPLYDAQDMEIKEREIKLVSQSEGKAEVAVTFQNFGEKKRILFRLVSTGKEWKIADIVYGDGGSLTSLLKN